VPNFFPLSLALFMAFVNTDNSYDTASFDYLAVSADFFHRCSYFHLYTPHLFAYMVIFYGVLPVI